MLRPRVSIKKLTVILSAAFVVLTLLTGIVALLLKGNPYEDQETMASSSSSKSSSKGESEDNLTDESSSSEDNSDENSSSDPSEEEPPVIPSFHVPSELRGVKLTEGTEYFITPESASPSSIAGEIDQAIASAQELTMNTIILDEKSQNENGFDSIDYAISKARENGLYVFVIYHVRQMMDGSEANSADGHSLDLAAERAGDFAAAYQPDAILLDGYAYASDASGYENYLANGSGIGYKNYARQIPESFLQACAKGIRKKAPDTQVGLLSAAVWENSTAHPEGSETTAAYTDLSDGNCDTRALLQEGLFDCIMVRNDGSAEEQQAAKFDVVTAWWAKEAQISNTPLYIMCGTVQSADPFEDLEQIPGIYGGAFHSLKALQSIPKDNPEADNPDNKDDPNNTDNTDNKDDKNNQENKDNQVKEEYVVTQLSLSKPAQLVFTTKEQSVTFQGASDPREPVTLNGQEIDTNESGYFTVQEKLNPGLNKFVIAHKEKSVTYEITREVDVLREVQPVGTMTVEGGMQIKVTALAYEGASVTASLGGQTITLSPTEALEDEELRQSGYGLYAGSFTALAASSEPVTMGTISVTASAQGASKTLQGASITVNKKAVLGTGGVIRVTADQAETFPISSSDDTSSPSCYPLPQGTLDMTSGDEIVYNVANQSYRYWKLQSGLRVYSDDIQAVNEVLPDNNVISNMSIQSTAQYTTVTLSTQYKVPYSVSYDGSNVVFGFKYTSVVPDSVTLNNNAIFASANWNGSNLMLRLRKAGGFIGYRAYYEGNDLKLRFNNAPGSLSGARIVVDPGHGGNDPGASGFYPGKNEADITLAIAQKLVAELQSRGASVLMTNPGSTMASRMAAARAFNPQVMVSIHGNSSEANPNASGTEVYYFYPFAKQLAANIAANGASSLQTTNRGAKTGYYYVTRESQFASVLVETGFVTNEREYTKLINAQYQTRIAQGIANGISGYLGGANSGGGTGGTDDIIDNGNSGNGSAGNGSGSEEATLELNQTSLTLEVGETAVLKASGAENVKWESDDEEVAEVSSSGKVTAVGEGTAIIWAYAGDQEAKCRVQVTAPEQEEKLEIQGESKLYLGDRETYRITGSSDVEWWVDDDSILTIIDEESDSCRIEAIGTGETYLYAESQENDRSECRFLISVRE